jgi:thiazole synthase
MPDPLPELDTPLTVAGRTFSSRLIVGTGKYADYPTMQAALDASGSQVITVAVRRERLVDKEGRSLLSFINTNRGGCGARLPPRPRAARADR